MKRWGDDPSPDLVSVFKAIAERQMAGLPICNPALQVEAVGFQPTVAGHWAGVMITPWAINLLCLPGEGADWPAAPVGATAAWRFPSGDYEFIVAEAPGLGCYHLCSLFSPAVEFESHAQARLTALAAAHALVAAPIAPPAAAPAATDTVNRRRAFLGLRG